MSRYKPKALKTNEKNRRYGRIKNLSLPMSELKIIRQRAQDQILEHVN